MKQMTTCDLCGKTVKLAGLYGHLKLKHHILRPKNGPEVAVPEAVLEQPAAVEQQVEKPKEGEEKVMEQKNQQAPTTQEHNLADCPECQRRQARITQLEGELTAARSNVEQLRQQGPSIPDNLEDVIKHCEDGSCESHKKQWEAIKGRIVKGVADNLPSDLISDKVIESEGLKRGLIPAKIIIPAR